MRSWSLLVEYIERWRNLVHNYKKCIDEASCIDTCVQGMHSRILYNLQANIPHYFEDLATRFDDLKFRLQDTEVTYQVIYVTRKIPRMKSRGMENQVSPKRLRQFPMFPQKSGSNLGPKLKSEFRPNKAQVQKKGLLTLTELKENVYPFSDSKVSGILYQLLL
ncbi:Uncharacterized protein Adt_11495 [Abeliophyllum distichum]|uniref:Uncharacterized protein n=1 Tax=Abeliophyllum distichum TaxID=126358 RepID=A0ABD1UN04_9LAMI